MDTIFVRDVREGSSAKQAGLQQGDRLVAVNRIPTAGKSYQEVVQLIANSPEYLHLLVVPKEEDVLQRFFPDTAYNPLSNQQPAYPEIPLDRASAKQILSQRIIQRAPQEFRVDAASWRYLQQQPYFYEYPQAGYYHHQQQQQQQRNQSAGRTHQRQEFARAGHQRSAESVLDSRPARAGQQQEIYAEIHHPNEVPLRQKSRALPQVPLYRKMGRRASEGSNLLSNEYSGATSLTSSEGSSEHYHPGMKAMHSEPLSLPSGGARVLEPSGYKLQHSEAPTRRESSSSLSSSIADSSKDSLISFGSNSTLTGHEIDDSVRISRVRQSVRQKEEFLRTPVFREFHGRPKKLDRPVWPPVEPLRPDRTAPGQKSTSNGGVPHVAAPLADAHSPRDKTAQLQREGGAHEAEVAPSFDEGSAGDSARQTIAEARRMNLHPHFQNVQKKAKEFENYPDANRTDFSRSELARLSKKVLLPNVNERALEYEVKTSDGSRKVEPAKEREPPAPAPVQPAVVVPPPVAATSVLKRIQRDSRSLDSSDIPSTPSESHQFRARSNSAESWTTAIGDKANTEPIVVKRRLKSRLGHDERARRPESYIKATKSDQNSFGSDLSDYEDVTPQVLRNGSGGSSTSSLDRDKTAASPVLFKKEHYGLVREGPVNCKILEIDGKRAADRSWKQVVMVLRGPKLFLFKDRHHQSPLGSSDVSLDQSLAAGVDMRSSAVQVDPDYTKRKNVFRMSTVKPCRSEFLIQAESTKDFADWVKTLQHQVAVSTEAESDQSGSRQQAVPQSYPASTTFQVQGGHLSPQPSTKNGKTSMSSRNRSPTGQSPVNKARKPSAQPDNTVPTTSPKSKTWRGRMAKQFKKFNQGASSPCSPTAPEGSTFGVPIEHCITSSHNSYLPRFVEVCTDIIDERGLQVIGIYRVPGNNASITALSEEINRNFDDVPLEDPRWNDFHVVSSLLKAFLRKMPDSLVTSALYPSFIKADKIEDPNLRLEELRRLVCSLPKHNYHTLKHVIRHLKRVADNSDANKMEAKNLAIVFGPTIVRPESESMESMVNNMTNQCKVVESLIANADWFFPENDNEVVVPVVPLAVHDTCDEFEMNNQALLDNISKYEALKDQKEKNGALLSSLFNAAQRKMRKPSRPHHHHESPKEEPTTPTGSQRTFGHFSSLNDNNQTSEGSLETGKGSMPTSVNELDAGGKQQQQQQHNKQSAEKNPWFNYKTDQSDLSRRIENFKKETERMLQKPRITEISVVDSRGPLSSSATNVNNTSRLSLKPHQDYHLTKTHSATNVFSRPSSTGNRNSLNSMDSAQYHSNQINNDVARYSYGAVTNSRQSANDKFVELGPKNFDSARYGIRRGSSVENVNSSATDLNSNAGLKKLKYENETDAHRKGSLDSLHKIAMDEDSLLSTMTKVFDQKLKEKSTVSADDIPYADEPSPEKLPSAKLTAEEKEPKTKASDLYKNPSLHKSFQPPNNALKIFKPLPEKLNDTAAGRKESKGEIPEKEEDTMASERVPDNDRYISLTLVAPGGRNTAPPAKLKRSESLNKPERSISAAATKVKRSESLKRSDSLTKTEKTESNINKRREILASGRRLKESTKNKRKNGMPDRSIKRRHTVGGTKDPDKVTYIMDNKNQNENDPNADNNKEKGVRTSSPDLSSTRRERFLFEINLIGPENMVVALRQHLIGSRPQSFPESNVFKVPLESHV